MINRNRPAIQNKPFNFARLYTKKTEKEVKIAGRLSEKRRLWPSMELKQLKK